MSCKFQDTKRWRSKIYKETLRYHIIFGIIVTLILVNHKEEKSGYKFIFLVWIRGVCHWFVYEAKCREQVCGRVEFILNTLWVPCKVSRQRGQIYSWRKDQTENGEKIRQGSKVDTREWRDFCFERNHAHQCIWILSYLHKILSTD